MTNWCSGILITIQLPLFIFTVGYRSTGNYNNSVGKVCGWTLVRIMLLLVSWATTCCFSSLVERQARLMEWETKRMEGISEWDHRIKVSGTHRQLRFRPSRDPSPPASRLLRQGGPAVPHACAPRNPDNAGTNCHNRPCNESPTRKSRASGSPSIDANRIRPPTYIR